MCALTFQLPAHFDDAGRQALERACLTGGQDNMPFPTDVAIEGDRLVLKRCVAETGSMQAHVPWRIEDAGELLTGTASLMERPEPYVLAVELARGKVNQVRSQASEWTMGGLLVPNTLAGEIRDATQAFSHALMCAPDADPTALAQQALKLGSSVSHQLAQQYVQRVCGLRHERQAKFESWLGCRLEAEPPIEAQGPLFTQAFNAVSLPFPWQKIEPSQGKFSFAAADRLTQWAVGQGLKIIGGPLIDFGGRHLPDWLWENVTDLTSLSNYLADYVETLVRRYQSSIRTWHITAGSNCAGVLARHDAELIWLTLRVADAVKRVNPQLEIIVGIAQPWGDYLVQQERSKTPFIFADDLLRTGIRLAALELEVVMGISPRGSYCRDLLDTSRLLDLYALLGVPIQATLGYPSLPAATPLACQDQRVNLGHWRGPHSDATQADWAASFAALALCKPYVRCVQWAHWSDAEPHLLPNCGVIDAQGRAKPGLEALARLRSEHLK